MSIIMESLTCYAKLVLYPIKCEKRRSCCALKSDITTTWSSDWSGEDLKDWKQESYLEMYYSLSLKYHPHKGWNTWSPDDVTVWGCYGMLENVDYPVKVDH